MPAEIETALLAPVLMVFALGAFEAGQCKEHRKAVSEAAMGAAALAASYQTPTASPTSQQRANVIAAAKAVSPNTQVRIFHVKNGGALGTVIDWAAGDSPPAVGTRYTLPAGKVAPQVVAIASQTYHSKIVTWFFSQFLLSTTAYQVSP